MENPASRGAKRGLQRNSFPASSVADIAISPFTTQQNFDPISWLAQRSGVALATAKAFAELNRFGGVHG